MNKKIIGISIAMLFAANGAFAQSTGTSSVELYGIIDLAVANVEYSLAADPNYPATVNAANATKTGVNQATTALINGGISPSRWGIRGTEDLGGGLKAIFNMDSYFNANNGTLSNAAQSLANNRPGTLTGSVSAASSVNGQLFNDQVWVGLADDTLGRLTFGRQLSTMADILKEYDAVQDAQAFSPLSLNGPYAGAGYTENKRLDNSIRYVNKFGDFNISAIAKLGGFAGKSSAGTAYGVGAGYEADGFGIQAAYQQSTDTVHAGNSFVAGDVNVTNANTEGYMVAAKYAFGDAKITGGFEEFTVKKPSDSFASLGVTSYAGFQICNVATTNFCASATKGAAADFTAADQKTDIFWVGGDYNFTPAFNLAVGFYDINPKQSDDLKQLKGNIYEYSLLADYHFSKRTDAYAGVMYSEYKGDAYPESTYNKSNYIFAIGMRTKF